MLLGVSALAASAQVVQWPLERSTHTMAWNDRAGEVMLLGGIDNAQDSALWSWNGERWRQRAFNGGSGRGHAAMAYDSHRNQLIVQGGFEAIFGTDTVNRFNDTWEWDGRSWRVVATDGPAQRDHHAMVYDPVRRVTILFGGNKFNGTSNDLLADTWSWDGRKWTKLADAGPPARATHRMVFDGARKRVVMFGGWGPDDKLLNDTWAWDGQAWTRIAEGGPSARFATRMAYDGARDRIVLFGGRGGAGDLGDTWEFDGQAWKQLELAGPPIRNIHDMAYDSKNRRVVMFGGFNAPRRFNDLWSFDGVQWRQHSRADALTPPNEVARLGPHAVGYRVINHWDHSRAQQPERDFEGNAFAGETATPMQISVWYPARSGGTALTLADYLALLATRTTLQEPDQAQLRSTSEGLQSLLRFQMSLDLPRRITDSLVTTPMHARRDAVPAEGRFPLIIGGLNDPGSAAGLAEFLASHGYVVMTTSSLPRLGAQQSVTPQLAIEAHTRDMEVVNAIARTLPFADPSRTGLLGRNFEGMAALNYQMRNMSADAVVSLDGWEGKTIGSLRSSPYYSVARLRVPYLLFTQDNPPSPELAFSPAILDALKYSERAAFVLKDMEHAQLLNDLRFVPQTSQVQRVGYDFMYSTIRAFFDAHVKGETVARGHFARSAVQRGFPAWLARVEDRRAGLPAIPTADEVESILTRGDVAKLRRIFQAAKQRDPEVQLFTPSSVNLFAFRLTHRGERDKAIDLHKLATEAFPDSGEAHNNLGNAYRDAGNIELALQSWRRFLQVAPTDPALGSDAERAQSISNIQQKIRQFER